MPNLLTITFSPCMDKSVSVNGLLPEKKMHCTTPIFAPGGGGINIARAIKKLGHPATAIFPVGGYTGQKFVQLLKEEGVDTIGIESRNEMRENLDVLDASTNQQYRFVMPAVDLLHNEWKDLLEAIRNHETLKYIIVSGSMPRGFPEDIFQLISTIAKEKNIRLVVDTSGEALLQVKDCGVFLIKPNLAELSLLAGRKEIHLADIEQVAREVIAKGYAEIVVVSIGATGAMLISKDGVFRAIPPVIKPKSTVGAGDSLVAGLVISLSEGRSLADSLRFGVSCGTAACLQPGTTLFTRADVDQIYLLTRVFNS